MKNDISLWELAAVCLKSGTENKSWVATRAVVKTSSCDPVNAAIPNRNTGRLGCNVGARKLCRFQLLLLHTGKCGEGFSLPRSANMNSLDDSITIIQQPLCGNDERRFPIQLCSSNQSKPPFTWMHLQEQLWLRHVVWIFAAITQTVKWSKTCVFFLRNNLLWCFKVFWQHQ